MTGRVLNIQRMSTEDGPGLRTTVFLKGCPLKCRWCHNPESIKFYKQLEWFESRCISCGNCTLACRNDALIMTDKGIVFDQEKCIKCLKCVESCPTNAIEVKGIDWEPNALVEELLKDKAYFGENGGITLSGGEALAQSDFAIAVCKLLCEKGQNIAIDTCGEVKYEALQKVSEYADLFLYDIKIMDVELHKKYTGVDNLLILDNLIKLADKLRKDKSAKIWIRTPLIPKATDSLENIIAIKDFINLNIADVVERWELCAFNNLCASKYERLGSHWEYEGVEKIEKDYADEILRSAKLNSKISDRTFLTGSTKL